MCLCACALLKIYIYISLSLYIYIYKITVLDINKQLCAMMKCRILSTKFQIFSEVLFTNHTHIIYIYICKKSNNFFLPLIYLYYVFTSAAYIYIFQNSTMNSYCQPFHPTFSHWLKKRKKGGGVGGVNKI